MYLGGGSAQRSSRGLPQRLLLLQPYKIQKQRSSCRKPRAPWSQNSGATPPCPPTPTTPPSLGGIPFDHPVIEPTFPREVPFPNSPQNVMGFPQDGKCIIVYFKTKLHLHMGAEGDEKAPYWLLRRPVRAEERPLTSPLPRAWGVTD